MTRAFTNRKSARAFTLIEVMIAMAVFFIVVFSILNVVVQSLGQARSLQKRHADPGMVAAMLTLTNCMEEASESGDFADLGDLYANQRWMWESGRLVESNEFLWRVHIAVFEKLPNGREAVEEMEVEFAKPACTGAGMRR